MTEPREDRAELECNGVTLDAWTSYSVDSDLFTPIDGATVSVGVGTSSMRDLRKNIERLEKLLVHDTEVKLWITSHGKRAVQGVYIVDGHEISNDADGGTQFTVSLRDRAMFLLSAADPKLYTSGDSLVAVARKAVKPWNMEVTADHVAARDLRQARITKDKYARLQNKARQAGVPPRLMSEKIAISIDKGTITFDDFLAAQAGGIYRQSQFNAITGKRDIIVDERQDRAFVTPLRDGNLQGARYSTEAGLSSLQIYQLRVQDVRPQQGESIWDFLNRHAERNGLLMSVTPDGKLLFCGLKYDQAPSYRFIRRMEQPAENNIISGSKRIDFSNVASEVVVYGRGKSKDETDEKGKNRERYKGLATKKKGEHGHLSFLRRTAVRDNSIKNRGDAQQRAEYELAKSMQGCQLFELTVPGHSQDGVFYAPDTVATIIDDVTGIYENWYVTGRAFTRDKGQGPRTKLRLVPIGSIVLGKPGEDG